MKSTPTLLKQSTAASDEELSSPAPARPYLVPPAATAPRIQLWDLPLRIFHWSLVGAVATAIATGLAGGAWMDLHGNAGLAVIGLVAFRLVWGFAGSEHARFASFFPHPSRILDYLRGRWQGYGHNPLGALSVLALLLMLTAQAITGLFSNDDISFTGPLAQLVGDDRSAAITAWHHVIVKGLYGLLCLHVAAIGFYALVRKSNLVRPMITGWKAVEAGTPPPRPARHWALLLALAGAGAAVLVASGAWINAAH